MRAALHALARRQLTRALEHIPIETPAQRHKTSAAATRLIDEIATYRWSPTMTQAKPTLRHAYGALAALLVEMREGWDIDQVLGELVGCPWTPRLVIESVLAARDDPSDRLSVRAAIVRLPSQTQRMPPEQLAAYRAHAQRILDRRHGNDE